jgi:hypothetical protein
VNKYQTYFGQKITDDELNEIFNSFSAAIEQFVQDFNYVGVAVGADVVQNTSPNLSALVSGPAVIYDQFGNRMSFGAALNVNCAADENNVSTAVIGGGNEKWISIFVKYQLAESDPRIDELGSIVFFRKVAGYQFHVVQGAEAGTGAAPRPALRGDQILLADIKLVSGQTTILNANISSTRSQVIFDLAGSPVAIRAKNLRSAAQAMLDAINGITTDTLIVPAIAGSPTSLPQGSVHAVFQAFLTAFNALATLVAEEPDIEPPDLTGVAMKASANDFTALNKFLGGFESSDQLFMTVSDPTRSLLATNVVPTSGNWKEIFAFRFGSSDAGGQYIRIYTGSSSSGATAGAFIIPINASWNGSQWELRDAALPAVALIWRYDHLVISKKDAGSGAWTFWPMDKPSGVAADMKGLLLAGDESVSGKLDVGGDVHAYSNLQIDGNLSIGGSFSAGTLKANSFEFITPTARTAEINLAAGIPEGEVSLSGEGNWEGGGGPTSTNIVRIPLRLPIGSVYTRIDIKYRNSVAITAQLVKKASVWGVYTTPDGYPSSSTDNMTPGLPSDQVLRQGSISTTDVVLEDRTYTLVMTVPDGATVYGARVVYQEWFPTRQGA